MGEAAVKRRDRPDYRAMWENQEGDSIRNAVIKELFNWSRANRGGLPDLGYPHEQPYYSPPRYPDSDKSRTAEAEPDHERAQAVEDALVMWRLIINYEQGEKWAAQRLTQLHDVLMYRFRDCMSVPQVAKKMHVSKRHAYRLIDEALYRFWVIVQ